MCRGYISSVAAKDVGYRGSCYRGSNFRRSRHPSPHHPSLASELFSTPRKYGCYDSWVPVGEAALLTGGGPDATLESHPVTSTAHTRPSRLETTMQTTSIGLNDARFACAHPARWFADARASLLFCTPRTGSLAAVKTAGGVGWWLAAGCRR